MKFVLLISIIFFISFAFGQKKINTKKRIANINIDGILDEQDWLDAMTVSGFTQITPDAGAKATVDTEVKVIYDDQGIYIGANCFGSSDIISKTLSQRDQYNSNTDYFSVLLDTYNDQLNGFVFSVSTVGVQYDAKIFEGSYNSKLDMIWYAEVQLHETGYTVEIFIPFSALRFSPKEVETWGINFTRYHSINREESSWNPILPDLENIVTQAGKLKGLSDITPPTRLFFSPYISSYADHIGGTEFNESTWITSFAGGMDVKYGLNEAYTLDMTLIPDFGQVVTDNVVLNLSPFEVFFQENRPFFNEGTELFEKTGHFYSRRVGFNLVERNNLSDQLNSSEIIINNPNTAPLINASKISGRGKNGLGIGFFNAISSEQYATARDTINSMDREILTSPLSNYNVFVVDQNLKNNSSVTLTNTSVWRSGHTYDANLTALATKLNTQNNNYFISSNFALSQKFNRKNNSFGHSLNIISGKQKGNFVFNLNYLEQSHTYDQNDMGFLERNNKRIASTRVAYNIYKPFWKINRLWSSFTNTYERLYQPDVFTNFNYEANLGITNKKFHSMSSSIFGTYLPNNDYFEPRIADLSIPFIRPMNIGGNLNLSSNYQKAFALDLNVRGTNHFEDDWWDFSLFVSPRFRFGDKIFLILGYEHIYNNNQRGYALPFNSENNQQASGYNALFVNRDVTTTTATAEIQWTVTNKSGFNFRLRHYRSKVDINEFFDLNTDGTLNSVELNANEIVNNNNEFIYKTNFNFFSIDLVYRWIFSPASEISIVWKNNINYSNDDPQMAFFNNLSSTLGNNQFNSFSIRAVYFIDFLNIKSAIGNIL